MCVWLGHFPWVCGGKNCPFGAVYAGNTVYPTFRGRGEGKRVVMAQGVGLVKKMPTVWLVGL